MHGHFPLIFVLKRMLNGCPEVHCHSTDLDFRLNGFGSLNGFHRIINDQMIASVTALFNMLQIVFFTFYLHVTALLDQSCHCVNILFKLTDDADSRNVLHFLFHPFHGDMLALHFFQNTGNTFYTPANLLNRRIKIIFFMLLYHMLELYCQLSDSKLVRA